MPSMTKAGYVPPKEQNKAPKKADPRKPDKKKQKRKGGKKGGISAAAAVSLAVFLLACLIGAATIYIYTQTTPYANTFLPGTMLLGYPLGGATMEEGQALLERITREDIDGFEVTLTWENQSYILSGADLSLEVDGDATLCALFERGHQGGMLNCFEEMIRLRREPMIAKPIVTYDMAAADELLGLIMQDIASEPESAQVSFTPGSAKPFEFTAESIGYSIDLTGVRAQIESAAASVKPSEIALEPEAIMPEITLEALQSATVLRSRVLTTIVAEEAARSNVLLAAKTLNGLRVDPGKTLSFNEVVGERSAERGYQIAEEPAYGSGVSGVGGGVCQLSGALYRLALLGGVGVAERSAAAYPVDYCEIGQEAAVSDQGIDLVIENTTDAPLFLSARTYEEDGSVFLNLEMIGEPLEGSYALVSSVLEETRLEEPVYVRDHEGKYATYDDERVEGGEGKPGYQALVERVAFDAEGNELSRETISTDVYDAVPPAIYIGVQKRD